MNDKKILIFYTIVVILLTYSVIDFFRTREEILKERDILLRSNEISIQSNAEENLWNNTAKINVILNQMKDSYEYSFDGGYTWQKEPNFTAIKNGKITIYVRENNKISEPVIFEINNIDNEKPEIKINMKKVYVGQAVNLKDYVTAVDKLSGLDGELKIEPEILDTSKSGENIVKCTATDKAGNEVHVSFLVNVLEEEKSPVTSKDTYTMMYRYRVKNDVNYVCEEHDCSYIDDNDIKDFINKDNFTDKCNASYNKTIKLDNQCIFTPQKNDNCRKMTIETNRYINNGEILVDIYALRKDGTQYVNGQDLNPSSFKAEPCGKDEMALNGYCHPICLTTAVSCPTTYQNIDGQCKKYVQKTCKKECSHTIYGDWTDWTSVKILDDEFVEVETKMVKVSE